MALTGTNVALGAGRVYIATYSSGSLEALPTATNARGTAWGGNWVELGYTRMATLKYADERKIVKAQQSTLGLRAFVVNQECQLEVELMESTLTNLKYVLGHGSLSTSGSSQVLTLSANPTISEYTLGLEFMAPSSNVTYAGHVRISRCIGMPDVELNASDEEETIYKGVWTALDHGDGGEFARWQYRYA